MRRRPWWPAPHRAPARARSRPPARPRSMSTGSCVAQTIAVPVAASARSSAATRSAFASSSWLVGSSSSTSGTSAPSARGDRDALGRSPPERSRTGRPSTGCRCSASNSSVARPGAGSSPRSVRPRATFASASSASARPPPCIANATRVRRWTARAVRIARHLLPQHRDGAGRRHLEPGERAQDRRLAGAAATAQHRQCAAGQVERDLARDVVVADPGQRGDGRARVERRGGNGRRSRQLVDRARRAQHDGVGGVGGVGGMPEAVAQVAG